MQETHVFAAVFLGACASGSLLLLAGIVLTALLTFSKQDLGRLVSKLLCSLEICLTMLTFLHLTCKRSVVRSIPFCNTFHSISGKVWPFRFCSVAVPFFDETVYRRTIVFLKWNVNFLLTATAIASGVPESNSASCTWAMVYEVSTDVGLTHHHFNHCLFLRQGSPQNQGLCPMGVNDSESGLQQKKKVRR